MKKDELLGKTADQLENLLKDMKKESMNLRFQKSSGELANTARVRVVRRTIARIETLLNTPDDQKPAPKATKTAKAAKPKTTTKKKAA